MYGEFCITSGCFFGDRGNSVWFGYRILEEELIIVGLPKTTRVGGGLSKINIATYSERSGSHLSSLAAIFEQ